MRAELRFVVRATPKRAFLALAAWSVPEALPTAISGFAVARAVDTGFLQGRPLLGLAWLGAFVVAAGIGAIGARQVYRRLGDLVEPFRDELVRRVVGGALRRGVAGGADDGAIGRLTRQVEIVRDTHAGIIVLMNQFVVTSIGVLGGLLSISPFVAGLLAPPFLLGLAAFIGTLGVSANRQRIAVRAEERLAATTGQALAGLRDVTASGTQAEVAAMAAGPIEEQAAAERGLARVAVLRACCFAIGGWLPLLVLLFAGPWLVGAGGLSAGALLGGMTYVLIGLQPALRNIHAGIGGAGLRFVITLERILEATEPAPEPARPGPPPQGYGLELRGVSFGYGPHAEPVLRAVDLTVPEGEHLAIVGPSGIGKSTLAGLLCGLLRPDSGTVAVGGVTAADLSAQALAATRVLIPQEAYVFAGTVWENISYLSTGAGPAEVDAALAAVGADALVERLGGTQAQLVPGELSAGERQLLALARAYLSPAKLVVLDEATCHLDPVAERQAELAFARRGGTLIVIAHRVSSALRARRVLVVDGAAPVLGEHRSLLRRSPLYRELFGHWESPHRREQELNNPTPGDSPVQRPLVYGTVLSAPGCPLPGAVLTMTDRYGRQQDLTGSDADGHYQLRPPEAGDYLLICTTDAHRPVAASVTVAGSVPVRHDVLLPQRSGRLRGQVLAERGEQGVAGAVLTLSAPAGGLLASTVSGGTGEFDFGAQPCGSYTLTVLGAGLRPTASTVLVTEHAQVQRRVSAQQPAPGQQAALLR